MSERRYRPWTKGSDYQLWQDENCVRCAKWDPEGREIRCELERAIFESMFGDGTISAAIAARLGIPPEGSLPARRCPEFEPREGPPDPAAGLAIYLSGGADEEAA